MGNHFLLLDLSTLLHLILAVINIYADYVSLYKTSVTISKKEVSPSGKRAIAFMIFLSIIKVETVPWWKSYSWRICFIVPLWMKSYVQKIELPRNLLHLFLRWFDRLLEYVISSVYFRCFMKSIKTISYCYRISIAYITICLGRAVILWKFTSLYFICT